MNQTLPFEPDTSISPVVVPFYDVQTSTFSYVVRDPQSSSCAIFDTVMDLDYASGKISYDGAERIIRYVKDNKLSVEWIIETHVHADHLSAASYLKKHLGGKVGIGADIIEIQEVFGEIFNEGSDFKRDGSQFDQLFSEGDRYSIGMMTMHVLHTPGHTPACMSYIVGNAAFVGDTLFMPDGGTARTDFPGGNASDLYYSITRLLSLPKEMRLFMCHDYGGEGREVEYETTVEAQRWGNIHVNDAISVSRFIEMRNARDATLDMPRLILPSLQVNMRAGNFPLAEDNGRVYLKLPLNAF